MVGNLSYSQLTLLIGGTLLVGILFCLAIYAIHRIVKRQGESSLSASPGVPNESLFAVAALQSALARMKAEQLELANSLRQAEQRAESNARILEVASRETPVALMVLNREGFLVQVNPALKTLLKIDTWSRRRYPEILGADSALAQCLEQCLEKGRVYRRETIEYRAPSGESRLLQLTLSPWSARNGQIEGAVCILLPQTPPQSPSAPGRTDPPSSPGSVA